MSEKEKKKESGEISRREFLKDAGLVVGGAAIGSTALLAACGEGEVTIETVTTTVTETVSKFICPSCSQEFASLAALQSHVEAEHPAAALDMVTLNVNGDTYELQVEPNWTLASVLHDKLGLTGVKIGCALGRCGACTVLVEGRPILSCTALAIELDGKSVTTIEGLAPSPDELHPLQTAFIEEAAVQCGYCIPGMLMSAKALLDKNPDPTEDDVRVAISGNICRCTGYALLTKAILAAAEMV